MAVAAASAAAALAASILQTILIRVETNDLFIWIPIRIAMQREQEKTSSHLHIWSNTSGNELVLRFVLMKDIISLHSSGTIFMPSVPPLLCPVVLPYIRRKHLKRDSKYLSQVLLKLTLNICTALYRVSEKKTGKGVLFVGHMWNVYSYMM